MISTKYQETDLFQEIQDMEEADFDSAAVHHLHLNSTTTASALDKCTSGGSIKRGSPSSFTFFEEPSPKRATRYPPSFTTTTTSPPLLPPPPPSFSNASLPNNFHSSRSDITALTQPMNSHSPEYSSRTYADTSAFASPCPVAVAASLALPPLHQVTPWRTLSDPTSSDYQPRPQLAKSPSLDQESHESKSLKRIKKKLKEMRQWVEKVTSEENDEDSYSEEDNCKIDYNSKEDEPEHGAEAQPQEAVWVENRNGEGLVLHFKCPCSKGYEIFLSGNTCYYRLM